MLYNGTDPFPDEQTLRLSDAFEDVSALGLPSGVPPNLELIVRIYNINEGHNQERVQ
ncbi:MAG: hypothetical protein LBE17_01935 [Treponema sp.]|nr:hypothetical protein [Treponema sp.]